MLRGQAAQQFGGSQGSGPPAGGGLGVAAAQQLAAVAAGGDRRRGHGVGAAHVLERGQHPVRDQHRRTQPAEDVGLRARRGRRRHRVLDAEPASDLGGDHDVRMIVEPVRLRPHRNTGRDERRGHQAAVLAAGEAELDRRCGLAQRRDRGHERGGHAGRASTVNRAEGIVDRGERPRQRVQGGGRRQGRHAGERGHGAEREASVEQRAGEQRIVLGQAPGGGRRPGRPVGDDHRAGHLRDVHGVHPGERGPRVDRRAPAARRRRPRPDRPRARRGRRRPVAEDAAPAEHRGPPVR